MNTVIGLIQSSSPFILVGEAAEKVLTGENLTDSDKRDFIRANLLAYLNANPDLVSFLNSLFSSKASYTSVANEYLKVFTLISGGGGFFDLLQLLGNPSLNNDIDDFNKAIQDILSENGSKYYNKISPLYNGNSRKLSKNINPALLGYSKFINDTFRIILGHEPKYFKCGDEKGDLKQAAVRVFKESYDIQHTFILVATFILQQLSVDPFTGWELFRKVNEILEDTPKLKPAHFIDTILDYVKPVDISGFENHAVVYDVEDLYDLLSGEDEISRVYLPGDIDTSVSIHILAVESGIYLTIEQSLSEEEREQMERDHPELFSQPNRQSSFFWSVENSKFYSAEYGSEIEDSTQIKKLISFLYTQLVYNYTEDKSPMQEEDNSSTKKRHTIPSQPVKGLSGRYQPSKRRVVPADIQSSIEDDLSGELEEVLLSADDSGEVMQTINQHVLPNYKERVTSFSIKKINGRYFAEFSIRGSNELHRRVLAAQKINVTEELELKFASNAWGIRFYVSAEEIRISSKNEQNTDLLSRGGTRGGVVIYRNGEQ